MRRLMLLRHAKTESQAASGRDFDRQLEARGIADAREIGEWLAAQDVTPQRVLVSSAARAQQTWHAARDALTKTPQAIDLPSLYNATPTELMRSVRAYGEDATPLMVVAHNPGLHELALALTAGGDEAARRALGDNLPTGALAVLDFDVSSWDDAGFRRGQLVQFVSPKSLREAAASKP